MTGPGGTAAWSYPHLPTTAFAECLVQGAIVVVFQCPGILGQRRWRRIHKTMRRQLEGLDAHTERDHRAGVTLAAGDTEIELPTTPHAQATVAVTLPPQATQRHRLVQQHQ